MWAARILSERAACGIPRGEWYILCMFTPCCVYCIETRAGLTISPYECDTPCRQTCLKYLVPTWRAKHVLTIWCRHVTCSLFGLIPVGCKIRGYSSKFGTKGIEAQGKEQTVVMESHLTCKPGDTSSKTHPGDMCIPAVRIRTPHVAGLVVGWRGTT